MHYIDDGKVHVGTVLSYQVVSILFSHQNGNKPLLPRSHVKTNHSKTVDNYPRTSDSFTCVE